MNRQEERNKKILTILHSSNSELILETIPDLREKGHVGLLPALIELLNTTENEEIIKSISELLFDLKIKQAIPVLIEAIQNDSNNKILQILVSSCWQNGMDYSEYLPVFIEVFIKTDYEIALEAFTVIENMIDSISSEQKTDSIKALKEKWDSMNKEKKFLCLELVHILEI